MKAFLIYKDRDFDPQQILVRRERDQRHNRGAGQELNLAQLLPWNQAALRQDLGLDILFNAMSLGDNFLFEVAQVAVLPSLTDPDAINYRQRVLADSVDNASVIRDMYRIAVAAIESERNNYWSSFGRYPAGTLHRAVDVLQQFVGRLKELRSVADRNAQRFQSEGFSRFFAMLRSELGDEYFAAIEDHLLQLRFRHGTLVSARLGSGNKGTDYVLRKPHDDKRNWLERLLAQKPGYSYRLHPRDEAGARALSALNDRGVNLVANALAQSTDHILSFFQMLRTELAYYIGCLNLRKQLRDLGMPLCFPRAIVAGERKLSFSGLYDVSLILTTRKSVVKNDLDADQRDAVIVTGANSGGKSTFLRSIGLAYVMMQAGMFVAADAFSSDVCSRLYTHYKREEDKDMKSGKLDEELSRMSAIIDVIEPNSVVLFNESFASTHEGEGSKIASEIVSALLGSRMKVFFVTHLYHFAHSLFVAGRDRAVFLRAERRPDGTRPFKLVKGAPLQTSYGEDLFGTIFSKPAETHAVSDEATPTVG